VRPLSRQKDSTQNIKIIKRTKPCQIGLIKRAKLDDLNDTIYMLIRPVVIKLLSEVWVG